LPQKGLSLRLKLLRGPGDDLGNRALAEAEAEKLL